MTVTLRRMRWRDFDAVIAVERVLFADDAWYPELFWSELAQHESRHYVVAVTGDDEVAGYAGLAVYGDGGYVQTIAVVASYQRQRLGARLLHDLLVEARRRGARDLALEVRTDNEPAQGLYRKFGLAPVGLRRGYYQPSGADALVMVVDGIDTAEYAERLESLLGRTRPLEAQR